MKIKNLAPKKRPNVRQAYHHWLVPEKPKKSSRLPQLNKSNGRIKSEFILMAERIG